MKQRLIGKSLLVALILMTVQSGVIAQNNNELTYYEKARRNLADITIEQMTQIMSPEEQNDLSSALDLRMANCASGYDSIVVKEEIIIERLGIRDEVNSLQTDSAGYQRGEEIDSLSTMDDLSRNYITERRNILKLRSFIDEQREVERKSKTFGIVKSQNVVSELFCKWARKKSGESVDAYKQRMREKSVSVFDSLCVYVIRDNIETCKVTYGRYSAAKQELGVSFTYYDDKGAQVDEQKVILKIIPEKYQKFITSKYEILPSSTISVSKGHLIYANVQMRIETLNEVYELVMPETKEVVINGNILEGKVVGNPLKNHQFDYNDYAWRLRDMMTMNDKIASIRKRYCETYEMSLSRSFQTLGLCDHRYSKSECEKTVSECEEFYSRQIYNYIFRGFPNPEKELVSFDEIKSDISAGYINALYDVIYMTFLKWVGKESALLTKEEVKTAVLDDVIIFRILQGKVVCGDKGLINELKAMKQYADDNLLTRFMDQEEYARTIVKNNEYLDSKISGKKGYYEELMKFLLKKRK